MLRSVFVDVAPLFEVSEKELQAFKYYLDEAVTARAREFRTTHFLQHAFVGGGVPLWLFHSSAAAGAA